MKCTAVFAAAAFAASLFPLVAAHGSVSAFIVGGKSYPGPMPASAPIDSAIRMISNIDPVKSSNVTTSDIVCGYGASPSATQVIPVTAGEAVQLQWRSGAVGTPWPHDMGPLMFYMGKCPGDATDCDGSTLKWFKIDQRGQSNPADGQDWFQANVMAGEPVNTTIPAQLEDGDYLFRHEILALHNAAGLGNAEFYPSCTQLRVTGGKGQAPPKSALVSFPGAYNENDPGIHVDVYTNFAYGEYKFPGPQPAFGAPSSTTPAPSKPTRKPKKCKVSSKKIANHKRAISRVMRRLSQHELQRMAS